MRWAPHGCTLASGSDDRTVRLWSIPWPPAQARAAPEAPACAGEALPPQELRDSLQAHTTAETPPACAGEAPPPRELRAGRVLGPHGARVWDVAFEDACGASVLTAGEDCICR